MAYIFICFIMLTKPLALVGDKCSFKPIESIKSVLASIMFFGLWLENTRNKIAIIPLVIMASLSAVKAILSF